jgi:hypothetical protein
MVVVISIIRNPMILYKKSGPDTLTCMTVMVRKRLRCQSRPVRLMAANLQAMVQTAAMAHLAYLSWRQCNQTDAFIASVQRASCRAHPWRRPASLFLRRNGPHGSWPDGRFWLRAGR